MPFTMLEIYTNNRNLKLFCKFTLNSDESFLFAQSMVYRPLFLQSYRIKMKLKDALQERSQSRCELCLAKENLDIFNVQPNEGLTSDTAIMLCSTCLDQLHGAAISASKHWYGLKDTVWSTAPAVQVMAYRVLHQLSAEPWAQDLLAQLYLDDATQTWADTEAAQND